MHLCEPYVAIRVLLHGLVNLNHQTGTFTNYLANHYQFKTAIIILSTFRNLRGAYSDRAFVELILWPRVTLSADWTAKISSDRLEYMDISSNAGFTLDSSIF